MATASPRKPASLVYGVDEAPPIGITLLSGLQHVGIISIALVYPLLIARAAQLSVEQTSNILAATMLVLGVGAVLQSLPRGPVGARYLCPPVCTAAYLDPALFAVKAGGMPLAFGMTAFGGLIETALSRLLRPLNLVFRLGVRKTQELKVDPSRLDPVAIEASFDEFNVDVRVSYSGPPLELPEKRPTNEEIMESEEGQRRLAGFMLRRDADRVAATHRGGRSTILFHFDH